MDQFWTMVLVTFILGALVVTGATILGERLGTKVGGLIGTLPHLVIIALYFIGRTQSADVAAQATVSIPVTMAVNVLFLFIFYKMAQRNRYTAPVGAMALWTLMVLPLVMFEFENLLLSMVSYIVVIPIVYLLFEKVSDLPSRKVPKMRYTTRILAGRGVLAGGVIAFAVIAAEYGGPILGGIFSVFPALFLSTVLIYTFEHDADYAGTMAKTMSIGGTSVVVYALAGFFLFPIYGMELGSLLGFLAAVLTAVALYPLIRKMR